MADVAPHDALLHGEGRVLNMSTGPVEVSRRVLAAQIASMTTPHHETFWALHDETLAMLRQVLRTRGHVVMMHGSIRSGIDVALGNLVGPGSRVLAIQNGFWGELLGDWAATRGAEVVRVDHGPLESLDLERVERLVRTGRFDMVSVVHVETNSGIVNQVEAIGRMVARTDALYLVDTACSAGAMPVETDLWHIDVQTTGSHKCLGSVPGLAVLTLSDKAWQRLNPRAMGAYFNLAAWWAATVDRSLPPPFTQPTSLVLALREALLERTAAGIEQWWSVHRSIGTRFMDAVRGAGFSMLLDGARPSHQRDDYSDSVMAIAYPDGMSDAAFRQQMLEEFGVFVIGNVGAYAGRSFRVGLMSPTQLAPASLNTTLAAMESVRKRLQAA